MAADEAQNLAAENVIGDTWLSIMNRVRNTSGVERVKIGWTSECRTVGTKTKEEQRYEGRDRSVARVLRCPLELGVMTSLR